MPRFKSPLGTPVSPRILSALRSRASKRLHGFTLVELIVVITILAILATIGFLALSGYTSDANKSAVVGNLRTVEKWLSTNATVTGKFPVPSNPVDVTYSGWIAWRQWTAGKSVMAAIGMGEPPKDPNGNSEFDYSLSANGMEYQVASAYLSAASADRFVTEASAATTDGTNVRTPTAAVTGNYNGLFVPVSTGGTNYLVAAPSIILSNVSLSSRELKTMSPSFVVDGKPGVPASWSGKVQWLSQTGIAFGWTAYASGKIFESATDAFPTTSTGRDSVASVLASAYSGTNLVSVPRISSFLASDASNRSFAVASAGTNSLGSGLSPSVAVPVPTQTQTEIPQANSCAANPSFANIGTLTVGSPTSVGQAWTYSATPRNCTYACASGWTGTSCSTATVVTVSWDDTAGRKWSDGTYAVSCSEYLNAPSGKQYSGSTGDGIYWIDPDGSGSNAAFKAYCDMTSDGGGWTMVLAQFEPDPVTDWNEGIQPDYDPTLATSKGFAFNTAQIPQHNQVAFGKDKVATFLDYAYFTYATGDVAKTELAGLKSGFATYHVHRNVSFYYAAHNPEESGANTAVWNGSLTFDKIGWRHLTWAFSPNQTTEMYRGYSLNGAKNGTSDAFAWTVWVRNVSGSVGIAGNETDGRRWADNTYATSCNGYKNPVSPKTYAGSTGDGTYVLDSDGSGPNVPYKVYCDMTTDGGGWTLVAWNKWISSAVPVNFFVSQSNLANAWNRTAANSAASINPESFSTSVNTTSAMLKSAAYSTTPILDLGFGKWDYNVVKCSWFLNHTSRTAGCTWQNANDNWNSHDALNLAIWQEWIVPQC